MIPNTNALGRLRQEWKSDQGFYFDQENGCVRGMVSGPEAVKQAAWLILHTERFWHMIFSFDYGVELAALGGRADAYLFPEIKRRVTEALLVDERMTETSDFVFRRLGTGVFVEFVLHTVFGEEEMELLVT